MNSYCMYIGLDRCEISVQKAALVDDILTTWPVESLTGSIVVIQEGEIMVTLILSFYFLYK